MLCSLRMGRWAFLGFSHLPGDHKQVDGSTAEEITGLQDEDLCGNKWLFHCWGSCLRDLTKWVGVVSGLCSVL